MTKATVVLFIIKTTQQEKITFNKRTVHLQTTETIP